VRRRDVERASLKLDLSASHRERGLASAQLEILARDVGGDRGACGAQKRLGAADLSFGGFDPAADAAEQVDLPRRFRAGAQRVPLSRLTARTLDIGKPAALIAGIDPAAGKPRGARHPGKGPRFVEPCDGKPRIEVSGQRLDDRRFQRRVTELAPPRGFGRRAADARRLRGIGAGSRDLRRNIVGTNGGTPREAKEQSGGRKLGEQRHWVNSCGLESAPEGRRASRRNTALRITT
jgi:hypothetical protein